MDRFVSQVDEELKCPICCGVLQDPLQGGGCEHAYCRSCIHEWLKTSESCPVDRNPLKPGLLQPIPRIVRNLLNHLQLRCDFRSAGCQQVVALEELEAHVSSCPLNPEYPVPCPKSCGALIAKNSLQTHDCVRDLRALLCAQQKEINELKTTMNNLIAIAAEQREIAHNNNSSLSALSSRYDHLKMSIQNLESPIRQILLLASKSGSSSAACDGSSSDLDGLDSGVKDHLAEETTTEIYISNVDRSVTPGTLQEFLMRSEINVISCKEALCRGWKNDFKVTVFKSDAGKILQPGLWPKGIVCFVCGEYYTTKTEGCRENEGSDYALKASVSPWMMS